ncbi:MAG: ATP-binding protein [Myxococcales bacterium]|nr:ATP-binding protein [Myxococcales bacterium]
MRIPMRKVLSVGTRWALLYTLVTLIALSLPIGFIYLSVKRQIETDARMLLESYLAEVRSEVEAHPERPEVAVRAFTSRLRRITPELDYGAALVRTDGSYAFRVGSLEKSAATRVPGTSRGLDSAGGEPAGRDPSYLVVTTPFAAGTLEAAISGRSFAGSVRQIRRLMLLAAPLALALSALCGAWLARRSLAPIAHMTDSARRISGENLSERIPTRGTNDELDRLAATLNGMFDRIGDAMERLRGVSADAAHQLKSPLASLQNEIEVTLEHARPDEDTRRLLEGILGQVAELGTSVGAMLRLARSESGLGEGQAVPVDLARLLDGVATLFQPMAEERGITLELLAGEVVEIQGDVAWLQELFSNLVHNAIAHTHAGGRISISHVAGRDAVEIQVVDDGEGIAKAEQKRIFDRFYRISQDRGVPGAGLGLALARQIAVAHGGAIRVESEPCHGSTFTVRLPKRERPQRKLSGNGSGPATTPRTRATAGAPTTSCSTIRPHAPR